ncbi:type II toxin-antitoxin system RelE family toxin [Streptomyces sp. AS58]|uniref:type II toxin-antitoxin system RelE family toxin n=1 Tax=Streptomyces sp. AS58 TaxID=1519489 RepID=UPI000A3FD2FF|nr:hypothetical protein [Streptomyces sp. AS58]
MSYKVIWEPEALAQAERFAKDDPAGVRQVFAAVNHLADDPRPQARSAVPICCVSMSAPTLRVSSGVASGS